MFYLEKETGLKLSLKFVDGSSFFASINSHSLMMDSVAIKVSSEVWNF